MGREVETLFPGSFALVMATGIISNALYFEDYRTLSAFGFWKHRACRIPTRYTPMLRALVFPLGMCALASLRLSLATDFPPLHTRSLGMVWVALAAWLVTAAGHAVSSWRSQRALAA